MASGSEDPKCPERSNSSASEAAPSPRYPPDVIIQAVSRELVRCEAILAHVNTGQVDNEEAIHAAMAHADAALSMAAALPEQHDLYVEAQLHRAHCFHALGIRKAAQSIQVAAQGEDMRDDKAQHQQLQGKGSRRGSMSSQTPEAPSNEETGEHQGKDSSSRGGGTDKEARGNMAEKHLIRDPTGRIVDVLDKRPALRSVRGKGFIHDRESGSS